MVDVITKILAALLIIPSVLISKHIWDFFFPNRITEDELLITTTMRIFFTFLVANLVAILMSGFSWAIVVGFVRGSFFTMFLWDAYNTYFYRRGRL